MSRYLIGSLLIFFLWIYPAHAQQSKDQVKELTMRMDSSKVVASKFDKEAISQYKEQKAFQYDDAQTDQLSLWDRFWMAFWRLIGKLFSEAASNSLSLYFFIALGVGIIVFIIFKLIKANALFNRQPKATTLSYEVITENIHEIDYEREIQRSIGEGQYRLAVRLLYLQALKKLSDARMIQWKPDKTNYQYLAEIARPELKQDFSALTLQFDYIWYGDFPIDQNDFEPLQQSFNQFRNQIK